ncbi:MAG: ABC transporter ATP-binding protein [Vallitaleaceae bacterium]|nr:ABC transporter ATP-binding protein [Vallitaleaceae bacterium]
MKKNTDKINKGWSIRKHLVRYRYHFILGLIALVIVDLLQLRVPLITGRVTDGLSSPDMTIAILRGEVLLILIIGGSIAVGRFIWRYFIFGASRKIEALIRADYFRHLETLSMTFYNKNKTGDLMAYATNDLNAIRMMVGPGLLMAFDALVLTVLVLYQMLTTINVQLTLVAIIPLPLIAGGSMLLGRSIRNRFRSKQEAFAGMSDMVQENISGIRVIKSYVQEIKEIRAFNIKNRHNYDMNLRVIRLQALMMPLAMMISGLSIAIALGYGGYMTMIGKITLGDFVAFIQYIMMMIWPMIAMGWCINIMSQGNASLTRLTNIMNQKPGIIDLEDASNDSIKEATLEFKHLSYTYPGTDTPVLKDINLTVNKGETLGIIGKTGCGKTTLMNLLVRLYNPPEGTIAIGGHDIYHWTVKSLRRSFGYVPQDNFLFSDTIFNNINFVKNKDLNKDVVDSATLADVHANIEDFTHGYDTIVGERGVTLSGGQKQRISIARAHLIDPLFLVLDDAVSAVDTKTEESILSALKTSRTDKTTIIIAHRISTIQDANQIIVMDEGRIIEQGNHDALMNLKGTYYKLVQKQQLEKIIGEQE